jgi:pseudaminic acid cytidylyltransferase
MTGMRLAVIPARGGSKRIPRKNIKPFAGQPMIAHAIHAALDCGVFDHVIVSTDDAEVAAVARAHGAEVPFMRPTELSDDFTPTVPVIRHATQWMSDNQGPVSHVCCIYSTAPFVTAQDIRQAYLTLVEERVKGYVFSATSFPFPIQRAFRIKPGGYCEMFQPEHYNTRSQDLEHAYQDAGQFYWGSAEAYLEGKIFFSPESKPHLLPRYRVQDIDTEQDWVRAEIMWRVLRESQALDSSAQRE